MRCIGREIGLQLVKELSKTLQDKCQVCIRVIMNRWWIVNSFNSRYLHSCKRDEMYISNSWEFSIYPYTSIHLQVSSNYESYISSSMTPHCKQDTIYISNSWKFSIYPYKSSHLQVSSNYESYISSSTTPHCKQDKMYISNRWKFDIYVIYNDS